jgi:hypothetical protein
MEDLPTMESTVKVHPTISPWSIRSAPSTDGFFYSAQLDASDNLGSLLSILPIISALNNFSLRMRVGLQRNVLIRRLGI